MHTRPVRLRRVRRTDFAAVAEILVASGLPAPSPDRANLRRFRRIVADLGGDLYVATAGARILGFVHITYARHIAMGNRAQIEALVVGPESRRRGVGSLLAALARRRAERRNCRDLRCSAGSERDAARAFLAHQGWRATGEEFGVDLVRQQGQTGDCGGRC